MQRVAILDLGMGNLRSVERALARSARDAKVEIAIAFARRAPRRLDAADKIVFPGQGAFRDAAAGLARGFGDALSAKTDRRPAHAPYLGICLGLQALVRRERRVAPGARGLRPLRRTGRCGSRTARAIPTRPARRSRCRTWSWEPPRHASGVAPARSRALRRTSPPFVYFLHSYFAQPDDASLVAATVTHGPHVITAAVQRENVTATQFHPEKSQTAGLALLAAFLAG